MPIGIGLGISPVLGGSGTGSGGESYPVGVVLNASGQPVLNESGEYLTNGNVPINNYVGMIGASSVANGGNLDGLMQVVSGTGVGGFHPWGIVLSNGALCFGGASATGGYTIQQVIDNHLATMLAADPPRGMIGISAGTNDKNGIAPGGVLDQGALDTRVEYIEDNFIAPVIADGRMPFLVAPQPNESTEGLVAMPALRLALMELAESYDIPFVDMFGALGDPNTGLYDDPDYDLDGLHLTSLGGQVAGQEFANTLTQYRNPNHNPRMVSVGDDTTGWAWQGGLMSDGDADNIPDGGGGSVVTDAWSAPANDATRLITAASDPVPGNWYGIVKTGTPGSSSTSQSPSTAPGRMDVVEGDAYEVAFYLRTNFADPNGGPGLKMHSTASGSVYLLYFLGSRADYQFPITKVWALGTVPTGVTTMRWLFGVEVSGGDGAIGTAEIAALSLSQVS